jgi:hypothetical protein
MIQLEAKKYVTNQVAGYRYACKFVYAGGTVCTKYIKYEVERLVVVPPVSNSAYTCRSTPADVAAV